MKEIIQNIAAVTFICCSIATPLLLTWLIYRYQLNKKEKDEAFNKILARIQPLLDKIINPQSDDQIFERGYIQAFSDELNRDWQRNVRILGNTAAAVTTMQNQLDEVNSCFEYRDNGSFVLQELTQYGVGEAGINEQKSFFVRWHAPTNSPVK